MNPTDWWNDMPAGLDRAAWLVACAEVAEVCREPGPRAGVLVLHAGRATTAMAAYSEALERLLAARNPSPPRVVQVER